MMSEAQVILDEVKVRYKTNKKLTKSDRVQVEKELLRLLEEPATFKDGLRLMLSFPVEISSRSCMQYVSNLDPQQRSGFAKDLIQSKNFDKKQGYNYLLPLIKGCIDLPDHTAIVLLEYLLHTLASADSKKYSAKFLIKFKEELLVSKALLKINLAEAGLTSSKIDLLAIITFHSLLDETGDQAELVSEYIVWFGFANKQIKLPADISIKLEKYATLFPADIQQLLENSGMVSRAKGSDSVHGRQKPETTSRAVADAKLQKGPYSIGSAEMQQGSSQPLVAPDYQAHLDALDKYISHQKHEINEAQKRISELEKRHARVASNLDVAEQKNSMLEGELLKRDEERVRLSAEIAQLKTLIVEQENNYEKSIEVKNNEIGQLLEQLKSEVGFAKNELLNILTRSLSFHLDEFSSIENKEVTPELGDHLKHITRKVFAELKKYGCFTDRG